MVLAGTACFVVMNAVVKSLRSELPLAEILWARTLGHVLFMTALFAPACGGWRLFVTHRPALQIARSVVLLISTTFFFTAILYVPLADATAVSFISPFVVAALSTPLLGERVRRDQWIAIAIGFLGALVVVRPTSLPNPWILMNFGNATSYAIYQILTRRVGRTDRPETSATYSGLVGAVLFTLVVPFVWQTPARPLHWVLLAVSGLLGGLGHYCVARALVWAPAAIVAPLHYVQLIGAALLGYLVFGDVPGIATWIGASIIIATGIYIAWREVH